jgi:hypothetical protein
MFLKNPSIGRFSLLFHFIIWFLIVSQLLRIGLFIWQYDEVSWNIVSLLRTLLTGFFFDTGTIAFVSLPAVIYYALLPNKFVGSLTDRIITWFFLSLTVFILVFTFFAELTFWDEFRTRFNFIAVDYLIYTHEVVANIQQSYPLPLLVGGVLLITAMVLFVFYKRKAFADTFTHTATLKTRMILLGSVAYWLCFIRHLSVIFTPNGRRTDTTPKFRNRVFIPFSPPSGITR